MNRRDFFGSLGGLAALGAVPSIASSQENGPHQTTLAHGDGNAIAKVARFDIPHSWKRLGLLLQRTIEGPGSSVIGDPCIVRDEDINGWRMFLFFDPPGCGQAVCPQGLDPGPGHWRLEGALRFANPQDLRGSAHKPYVVMDAYHPNQAAKIDGQFRLLTVSWRDGHKVVQQSVASKLAGPWKVQPEPLIACGAAGDFDAKHVDAVTGFHFPERRESFTSIWVIPNRSRPGRSAHWEAHKPSPYRKGREFCPQARGTAAALSNSWTLGIRLGWWIANPAR